MKSKFWEIFIACCMAFIILNMGITYFRSDKKASALDPTVKTEDSILKSVAESEKDKPKTFKQGETVCIGDMKLKAIYKYETTSNMPYVIFVTGQPQQVPIEIIHSCEEE